MEPESTSLPPGGLQPGQVIDQFRLDEHTHVGGMAQLWRVTRLDNSDPMPLIMKVPRIKGGEDPTTIVGFEVEQMIMPTLSGVHVPRYVAKGDFTRQPYIVMERIDGPSLKPRFDAAPLPIEEVVHIGTQVAIALHDLHRQHVIHLDVKPSNIMFRERTANGGGGEAVLVDFGLSRHDHLPDLLEEEFELPMGTGPYMSPEQVQFVRNDPRSDLFALGVLLYHLTTGERPFGAPTSVRGLRQRLYRDPVPPRALRADCPPWLQEVILSCLEVQPSRRCQSGAQLSFNLQHPDQVALTDRATRVVRGGVLQVARRWLAALGAEPVVEANASAQAVRSPIVMAAIDIIGADPDLLTAVRNSVQRLLATEPGSRLACVAVLRTNRVAMDEPLDKDGSSKHVNLLVQLKHWARPVLRAAAPGGVEQDGRLTFHVLEAPDPGNALLEFARKNQVDHIVMGARSSGGLRRYLGSVSAKVATEAACTVTVVRAASDPDASAA